MSDLTAAELADLATTRPDLVQLMTRGLGAVMAHILDLEKRLRATGERLEKSRRTIIPNSRTSHSPPSQDPRPKPRSRRVKSGKKSGGQPGHAGHRLEPVATPDEVVEHPVIECHHCQTDLRREPIAAIRRHQVFDLPKIRLEVTEHRCEQKACPECRQVTTAAAPAEASQLTQYGLRLSGFAVYLNAGHFVPIARTCDIIQALTGSRPSQGWVMECQKRVSKNLDGFMDRVTDLLKKAATIFCDETGFRFCAERFWLHVCSTAMLTLLMISRFRGTKAMREMGILGNIRQTAIHDHYSSYFTYDNKHGMCNAHHVRELTFVYEEMGQKWGRRMIRVLIDGKKIKELYHPKGQQVPEEEIDGITRRYRAALVAGYSVNPPPPPPLKVKPGKKTRGKVLCLLDRLQNLERETLRFLHDPTVPWENNQAERDLRMAKVQQKVSGGFRTEAGADIFARCRSYLDTMRKQGHDTMAGIIAALEGKAWMPKSTSRGRHRTKKRQAA
jgi:hypothetical protein